MISFDDLVEFVRPIRILGTMRPVVEGASQLASCGANEISFCSFHGETGIEQMASSNARIILAYDDMPGIEKIAITKCILTVVNPKLTFMRFLNHFFTNEVKWGVHPSAIVEKDVELPEKIRIGPMAYVGHSAEIGNGCIIEGRVHIESGAIVGSNVYVQAGAVIGCEGQGMIRNEEAVFERFPQYGNVVIEDNVEIGANTTIVKATFESTIIGEGSKIGHLCDIGHNVCIGKHVFISAGVIICGSSSIGDYSWLAPGALIRDGLVVGENATIGMGAVVVKDVPAGATVLGNPARERVSHR